MDERAVVAAGAAPRQYRLSFHVSEMILFLRGLCADARPSYALKRSFDVCLQLSRMVQAPGEKRYTLNSLPSIHAFLKLGALQYTMNIQAAGYPILGCRLILNLRESYYQPFAEEVAVSTKSMPQFTPDYTPQLEQFEMPTTISRTSEGILVSLPSTR